MNNGLHFENLATLIFAFLAFIFLLFGYGMFQINSVDAPQAFCGVIDYASEIPDGFEKEIQLGKQLFKNNCASCHAKNMKAKMTGPALADVEERWNRNKGNLYAWIRNSQAFLATGDEYANALYLKNNQSVMTAFPNLTDAEIEGILGFIDFVSNQ